MREDRCIWVLAPHISRFLTVISLPLILPYQVVCIKRRPSSPRSLLRGGHGPKADTHTLFVCGPLLTYTCLCVCAVCGVSLCLGMRGSVGLFVRWHSTFQRPFAFCLLCFLAAAVSCPFLTMPRPPKLSTLLHSLYNEVCAGLWVYLCGGTPHFSFLLHFVCSVCLLLLLLPYHVHFSPCLDLPSSLLCCTHCTTTAAPHVRVKYCFQCVC